jgi:micrococcal nuclease
VLALVSILVIAGCGGAADVDGSTPEQTETGTTSETALPAAADSSPTATPTPSATAAPTATPTPSPTATPTTTATESTATPTTTATESTATTRPPTATTTTAFGDRTSWQVEVLRVVDGDTLEVAFPDGHTESVRLLGVDTPEVHVENTPDEFEGVPETAAGRDWLRDWGHRASEFARTQLAGETVRIATDPDADRRGSHGRLLVYVHDDGRNVNLELLRQGYARLYDAPFALRPEFQSAEATAQQNDVGLWSDDASRTAAITDAESEVGRVSVVAVHADAEGDDHDNPNGEWVVLENTGDAELDLTGWTLGDAAGHTYRFPDGVTLAPGERVTLYTGGGTDSADDLYWGADGAVWNNDGDTVIVRDAEGDVVVEHEY